MQGSLRWRVILIIIVLILGMIYALPSVPGIESSGLTKILPDNKINLGLDLKGGIHLTLGVDVQKAIENSLAQMGQDIRSEAREENILVLRPRVLQEGKLQFLLLKKEQQKPLEDLLEQKFSHLKIESRESLGQGKVKYVLSLTPKYKEHLTRLTLDQAIKTIRNRIDQFGVAEPDIRRQEGNRIQVQLPGLDDPQRAIKIIG